RHAKEFGQNQGMWTVHPSVVHDIRPSEQSADQPLYEREQCVRKRAEQPQVDEPDGNHRADTLSQRGPIPWGKERESISNSGERIRQGPHSDQSDRITRSIRLIPIAKEKPSHTASCSLTGDFISADRVGSNMTSPAQSQNGSIMRMIMKVLAPIP